MLVQLSSWQTTKTSIGARKRRKPTTQTPPSVVDTMASFVNGQRRSRQRRKQHGDDMVSQVILTSSHKASLVGHLRSKASSWQESKEHEYTTRPGPPFAFIGTNALPIAAVMDGRKDKIYALQNQNKTLIAWHAAEEPEKGQLFSLPAPALSLRLNQDFAYGTCENGSAFIAQMVRNDATKTDRLQVQLFDTCVHSAVHLHTVLEESTHTNDVLVGEKRKINDDVHASFILYQVFCKANQLTVVKRNLTIKANLLQNCDSFICTQTTDLALDTSRIMTASLDESTIVLVVQITPNKTQKDSQYRAFPLCLMTAQIGPSIELPSTTRQVGGLSSALMAVGTVDQLLLYDTIHGTLLQVESLASVVSDTKDWRLVTDPKRNRLLIVSHQEHDVFVSLATLENTETYSLATALQSISRIDGFQHDIRDVHLLQALDSPENDTAHEETAAISRALASLRLCLHQISDNRQKETQTHSFMDAYECALAMLVTPSASTNKELHVANCAPKNGTNGNHVHEKHTTPTSANSRGCTPSRTPQEFIDGATTIIIQILQIKKSEDEVVGDRFKSARSDATIILLRLIQTGTISARTHFKITVNEAEDADAHDSEFLALLRSITSSQNNGSRVVSPIDLMHAMLSSCPDLTERHLVTMIHYMLCTALPEDIADNFIDWKRFDISHPYTKVSKAYFEELSTVKKIGKLNGASLTSPQMKQAKLQLAKVATKLLRMGAAFLIERVVEYSDCNGTLLRTALQQGLTLSTEPQLLSRFLLETLTKKRSKASCKWIFALCEGCGDRLADAGDGSSASTYQDILAKVKRITHDGELITGLARYLGAPPSKTAQNIDTTMKVKVNKSAKSRKGKSNDDQLPDYCIEQLIF